MDDTKIKDVPYLVHEGAMVRLERMNRRLWISTIILVALLFISNGLWIYFQSQFESVSTTITQDNLDGINNYIGNDGDITNGKTDN